ncbi:hypothetical protein BASA81_008729 [Batrachochytrium salamandrivorans]|nr:hypothetical protein BASA81_008729 [Batrachochytrium salamandrivorans]
MVWNVAVFSACTLLAPFVLGMVFFSTWIFRDVQVRWGLGFNTQLAFSLTLAICFQLYSTILGEVGGFISKDYRELVWKVDLFCLVVLLRGVLPFLCTFAMASRVVRQFPLRLGLATGLFLGWMFIEIGSRRSGGSGSDSHKVELESEIQTLGMVGLASVAVLSGWGSVHGPYAYGIWFDKQSSDEEILFVSQRLLSVMEMQSALKRKLAHCRSATADLREEIVSLEMLSDELFMEFNAMKMAKSQQAFRKTVLGRIYSLLGVVFALYCLWKIALSLYGIAFPKSVSDPDLITNTLRVVSLLVGRQSARLVHDVISFSMVGVLVFNSFRGLLVALGKVFHQIGLRVDSLLVGLLLTEVMGHYLLSSLILLDMNVPTQYRSKLLYGKFEFFRWTK